MEVQSPDVCRAGEIVLTGGLEAKTVISKGSLVFRVPLERSRLCRRDHRAPDAG